MGARQSRIKYKDHDLVCTRTTNSTVIVPNQARRRNVGRHSVLSLSYFGPSSIPAQSSTGHHFSFPRPQLLVSWRWVSPAWVDGNDDDHDDDDGDDDDDKNITSLVSASTKFFRRNNHFHPDLVSLLILDNHT